ncbi:hypothetical protein ABZ829_11805 [Streptomyces xanthochromogenes]|uniref:immunity protein TriTu family protein n=1 Tax=Streptomyces xanthochromogenes TaxID=67384 RepID=UPI00343E6C94
MKELPQMLQAWFTENEERLRSCGVTGDIQRSPDDGRSKTSARMTVETDGCVAMLIVWDSGEAELECGDLASGQVQQEHRDLRTPGELFDAIETVLARVSDGRWMATGFIHGLWDQARIP